MTPDEWPERYDDLRASHYDFPDDYTWAEWEALSFEERAAAHKRQEEFDLALSRMKAGLT